jgi:hypothetical protein
MYDFTVGPLQSMKLMAGALMIVAAAWPLRIRRVSRPRNGLALQKKPYRP